MTPYSHVYVYVYIHGHGYVHGQYIIIYMIILSFKSKSTV